MHKVNAVLCVGKERSQVFLEGLLVRLGERLREALKERLCLRLVGVDSVLQFLLGDELLLDL